MEGPMVIVHVFARIPQPGTRKVWRGLDTKATCYTQSIFVDIYALVSSAIDVVVQI